MSPIEDDPTRREMQAEKREARSTPRIVPCMWCNRLDYYGVCITCAYWSVWMLTPDEREALGYNREPNVPPASAERR